MPDILTPLTWPVGTKVTLCSVPWASDYRDVVAFETPAARDAYFAGAMGGCPKWAAETFSYLRPGDPVSVPVPFSTAYRFNYAVVENPMQPVTDEGPARKLYYFVTACTYDTPQGCTLTLQLDVMTTYQFDLTFGNMFVESGHVGVACDGVAEALADVTGDQLREYLTVPEGLDVGTDYYAGKRWYYPLADGQQNQWRVIVVSTVDLTKDPGTIEAPKLRTAYGQIADGLPSGCNVYSIENMGVGNFMIKLQNYSWVSQGIISITTFPAGLLPEGTPVSLLGDDTFSIRLLADSSGGMGKEDVLTVANVFTELAASSGVDFGSYYKALAYPYSVIEVSNFTGGSLMLKPEGLHGKNLAFNIMTCALAPFARVGIVPQDYDSSKPGFGVTFNYKNLTGGTVQGFVPAGEGFANALWLSDFPQFSIVNNAYITYMASSANTRHYNYASAGWGLAKGIASANLAYDQAQESITTNAANYGASAQGLLAQGGDYVLNQLDAAHNAPAVNIGPDLFTAGYNLIDSALSTASGGAWGASNIVQNLSGLTEFRNNQALSRYNADTNRRYADFANQGDYAMQVRAIDAAVQDAALTPPSIVGQMGGNGFAWQHGLCGFAVTLKHAGGAQMRAVLDVWRRYGYKVNRFVNMSGAQGLRSLCLMSKFTYWRVLETYLECPVGNDSELATIRGVLEKGVTVWNNPEDIGRTKVEENEVVERVAY